MSRGGTVWIDLLLLVAMTLLSLVAYVGRIGFYSDDWQMLESLALHGDLSHAGRFTDFMQARPTQVAYSALLFRLFGLGPLGYHIVNAAMLAGMIVLTYLVLHELRVSRPVSFAVAVLYGLLPHYATNRFWYAAFGYTMSMALVLLAIYGDLRGLRSGGPRAWGWKALVLGCLVVAGLGYEVVIPVAAAGTLLTWWVAWRRPVGQSARSLRGFAWFGGNLIVLAGVVAFKAAFAEGVGVSIDYHLHLLRLVLGSLTMNFGSLGLTLPHAVNWSRSFLPASTFVLAGLAAMLVYARLARDVSVPVRRASRGMALRLAGAGLLVYAVGYAIFLSNDRILFSSTGISNRVSIAAAMGVAMTFVAAVLWVAGVVSSPAVGRHLFAVGVAGLCLACFIVVNGIAVHWARAWQSQHTAIEQIAEEFPAPPPGTTFLLDGVCPYMGPAIVFDSYYDLRGALRVRYRDPSLQADVVSRNVEVREMGLRTRLYGDKVTDYPYGPDLLVFDARTGRSRTLATVEDARRFLGSAANTSCPGRAGQGVNILDLDGRYQRFERERLWGGG